MSRAIHQFADVNPLAQRLKPEISRFDEESFGPFRYSPEGLYSGDPYFEYSGPNGLKTIVHLANSSSGIVEISSVAVLLDGEWWSVDQYEVCHGLPHILERSKPEEVSYPHFRFRWQASDITNGEIGQLNYAEITIAPCKSAFFSYSNCGQETRVLHNMPSSAGLPSSLLGQTHFLGRPIIWKLDIDKKAREILVASQLEGFLLSVPIR